MNIYVAPQVFSGMAACRALFLQLILLLPLRSGRLSQNYGWMYEWMGGWMDEWMDLSMSGWMGGWIDDWTDRVMTLWGSFRWYLIRTLLICVPAYYHSTNLCVAYKLVQLIKNSREALGIKQNGACIVCFIVNGLLLLMCPCVLAMYSNAPAFMGPFIYSGHLCAPFDLQSQNWQMRGRSGGILPRGLVVWQGPGQRCGVNEVGVNVKKGNCEI